MMLDPFSIPAGFFPAWFRAPWRASLSRDDPEGRHAPRATVLPGRGLLVGGKVERAGAQPRASVRPGVER